MLDAIPSPRKDSHPSDRFRDSNIPALSRSLSFLSYSPSAQLPHCDFQIPSRVIRPEQRLQITPDCDGKMSGELPQRFETLQLHAGYVLLSAMGCHDCADKMLTARSLTRRLGLARHPSTRPLCVLATSSCAMASKTDLRSLTCSMTPHMARGCSASRNLAISTVAL